MRAKRAGLDVSTEMVAAHMGKPAITITRDAPIGEAAALMLASNIRRLPIVDAGMLPIGLLSRTDVFKAGSLVARISVNDCPPAPAPPPELVVGASSPLTPWRIKYLYDGDCAMCQSLMNVLSRQDGGRGIIKFVNIADPAYAPQDNANVAYEEAMETIHAIRPDGSMALGTDALRELFGAVGLGWAAALIDNPITSKVVDWVYDLLSKYRLPIGKGMDFVVAAKRIKMSSEGVQTCGDLDGDGCQVEW